MPETAYIVLRDVEGADDDAAWGFIVAIKATSAHDAIRKALSGPHAPNNGTYVAVPQRSWKPVTVTAQQTTVLKLSSPDSPPDSQ